MNILFDVYF